MGKRFKVGLALGGGGVRGFAHIGVLKVLERMHLPIDIIVGSSMGSVVGGSYALCGNMLDVEQKMLALLRKPTIADLESLAGSSRPEEKKKIVEALASFVKELVLWNLKGVKRWITDGTGVKSLVKELVDDADFSQLKIPFACIASDLKTGEEVILNEGKIVEAIIASSSMPGVFPPVHLQGRLLIDGGIVSELPIEATRKLGADFVIAVNVEENVFHDRFEHGMDILFQADEIRCHELVRMKLALADFVIQPNVGDFSWAAFSHAARCIQEGEKAAQDICGRLKFAIGRKKIKKFLLFK